MTYTHVLNRGGIWLAWWIGSATVSLESAKASALPRCRSMGRTRSSSAWRNVNWFRCHLIGCGRGAASRGDRPRVCGSAGAGTHTGIPHFDVKIEIESALRAACPALTVLRPDRPRLPSVPVEPRFSDLRDTSCRSWPG